MTRDELRYQWVKDAHKELDKIRNTDLTGQVHWLRQAFTAHYWGSEDLRLDLKELRELALAWLNESGREITIKEAQMLDACRICKKKPTGALILDGGKEYACQSCLQKEDTLELIENVREVLYKSVHHICSGLDRCWDCRFKRAYSHTTCSACQESLDFVKRIDEMLKEIDAYAKHVQSQAQQASPGLSPRKGDCPGGKTIPEWIKKALESCPRSSSPSSTSS